MNTLEQFKTLNEQEMIETNGAGKNKISIKIGKIIIVL